MKPFTQVEGRAYPFGRTNIDTDVIIPAEFLKTISREGLGEGAFKTVREEAGNVFDDPAYAGATVLIAGDNFGCGSSREHAAWALEDMGVRVVIAPSFSDIFSGNVFKNGILAAELPQEAIDRLIEVAADGLEITVDLENQVVTTPFQDRFEFPIDTFRKECLLAGRDEIGLTLESDAAIAAFEQKMTAQRGWMAPQAK
ncbi:MAG: 3-isopropylmalate dehydratase small subunit [Sphingomonadaceae bacterium]|nr:3-isopropylmalate dehydratase small subunit [Sphingomonadaceae bacterium]